MEFLAVEQPFLHILVADVLSSTAEANALSVLRKLEWKEHASGFFRINVAAHAEQLANLSDLPALATMMQDMKAALEVQLQENLGSDATMVAQMYDVDSVIGFHTDSADRSVRLVLNLNEGWQASHGGAWVLANPPTADHALFLPPLSNTAFAFPTSSCSFHALTRRSTGRSYALIVKYPVA